MPFNRFYLDQQLHPEEEVFLIDSEHHHLAHVMRLAVGETVELVNGKGALAKAKLESLDRKKAKLLIESVEKAPESLPQILLAVPFLRPSKLEWIVEKGSELGVDSFLFYPAEKGDKKNYSSNQTERLQTLAIAAMKQSGRLFLPHFEFLARFSDLFEKKVSILYGDTRPSALALEKVEFPILFITGPESGFSNSEYAELDQKAASVKLGPYVLRTETAPLAAASILGWKKILTPNLQ